MKENLPKEAKVGVKEISEPLISALAISVMQTIAGLVPHAADKTFFKIFKKNYVNFLKILKPFYPTNWNSKKKYNINSYKEQYIL